MFNRVTIDLITRHDSTGDYSLYLKEQAGWNGDPARLRQLQDRVYNALDVVLDGQLASDYPDSKGSMVRVVVVFLGQDAPLDAIGVLERLHEYANTHSDFAPSAISRGLVSGLAITYKITG